MNKYQIYSIIGIALIAFNLPSTTAECSEDYFEAIGFCFMKNPKCPDKSIFFKDQCYNILKGDCNTDELWIKDKCCTLNCMGFCTDGNCEYCCRNGAPSVEPITNCPNQPVTPYPVEVTKPIPPTGGCPNQPITPCQNQPMTPCPNQPITPCQNQPMTPCPNQPITPCQNQPMTPCQNQPMTPCSNQPTTPCQNQPITPCLNQPTTLCPNQPPCSNQPTTPCQNQPMTLCPNQPVTPCAIVPINPIVPNDNRIYNNQMPCNQPTSCTSVQNCVSNFNPLCLQGSNQSGCYTNIIQPPSYPSSSCVTTPLPMIPTTTRKTIVNIPFPTRTPPPPTVSTTTTVPSTAPSTTSPPPPANIYKCPPGTILVGNTCHLLYCPRGSIMKDNRCVVIECPEGTVWTGHRCSMPEPMNLNVTLFQTVVTNFNHSQPDIILTSTNNVVVNASMTLNADSAGNDCTSKGDDCDKIPPPSDPNKCCDVMTPRICESRDNRWHCYSRRYRRCGDFCVKPIIYLRPPRVQARSNCVVMPPLQEDCQSNGNCGQLTGGYDCSGCGMGHMERCSYYCYRYSCPSQKCGFYDQKQFCSHNADSYGCQEEDGCYGDWCQ